MRNKLVAFGILVELLLISLLLVAQAHAEDLITISNVKKTYCGRLATYEMTVDNQLCSDIQAIVVLLTHAGLNGLDYDFKLIRTLIPAKSRKDVSFTSALPRGVYATKVRLDSVADTEGRWYDVEH